MAALPYPSYHDSPSKKHQRSGGSVDARPLLNYTSPPSYVQRRPGHHHQPENIYDDIDGGHQKHVKSHRRGDGYGTTHESSVVPEINLRSAEEAGQGEFTDAASTANNLHHVPPVGVCLRDIPWQLSDGTETEVRYKTGQYTKLVVIVLFFSLLPFGLCFLGFLPFCLKCKWSKDIYHIDPVTRVSVGRFVRGTIDAPQILHYQRVVQRETTRTASLRRVTRQPSSTVPQQIVFGPNPVTLPDQTLTVVRKRVGFGNLVAAIITLCICVFIPFGWILLPCLVLLCFGLSCLKDTEHLHRETGSIIGAYYRCQS